MTVMVMEDQEKMSRLADGLAALGAFDRLVLQLRWSEGLTRLETALALDAEPARVLAAEMRLRAWAAAARAAVS